MLGGVLGAALRSGGGGGGGSGLTAVRISTLGSDSTGWNGYTLRERVFASSIANGSYTKIRITIKAGPTEGLDIAAMYVGFKGSGAYDFAATPTQITFNSGSGTVSIAANTEQVSDEIDFVFDGTVDLVISSYTNTTNDSYSGDAAGTTSTIGYKNANDPTGLTVTGYAVGGTEDIIRKIEAR